MSWIKASLLLLIALVLCLSWGLSFSNIIYLHRITEELVEETTTNTNMYKLKLPMWSLS